MKDSQYTAQVRPRLLGQGFAELPAPADMTLTLSLVRVESWGRLLLAVAPIGIGDQPAAREALVNASGAWVRNMQRRGAEPCYMVLIFPFDRRVPDALSDAVKALRREEPQRRWGVMPWTADLAVELVDRHAGFPRVDDGVAHALTELERGALAESWDRLTGPQIAGRRPAHRHGPHAGHPADSRCYRQLLPLGGDRRRRAGGVLAAFLAGIPGERKPWRFVAMAAAGLAVLLLVAGALPLPQLGR